MRQAFLILPTNKVSLNEGQLTPTVPGQPSLVRDPAWHPGIPVMQWCPVPKLPNRTVDFGVALREYLIQQGV